MVFALSQITQSDFEPILQPWSMDGRTVPNLYHVLKSVLVRIFIRTVRDTDFGTDPNLVRYVVRILVRKNPYRNERDFFAYEIRTLTRTGTDFGTKFTCQMYRTK